MDLSLPLSSEVTETIIPQKQPFVLVSSLLDITETGCQTAFTIPEGHILTDAHRLQPSGLLEHMAQSCALMMGYRGALQVANSNGADLPEPKVGFIGDIRAFQCSALPEVGTTIQTQITIENQIFDVTMIEGQVSQNGTPIASCKMKIFVKN
ncbi:MAG: 3-hydroxyacyl-ACP dehydratase [Chitinophagales bacterium]|nr:3-hydroxyacyl-ACP dehydratase [Chitinophagales bacterium]